MNHFEELIKELAKGKDKKLIEYTKANIIRTFCPHMFFQDLEKVQCKDSKGRPKTGYSCEKCWGCKIIIEKEGKKKNEKETNSRIKPSKTNGDKKPKTRIRKNKNTRR